MISGFLLASSPLVGAAQTPSYAPALCSTSNRTAIISGMVTGLAAPVGVTTTFPFSTNVQGNCGGNAFTDTKIALSGFMWNKELSTTKICDLTLKVVPHAVVGGSFPWDLQFGLNTSTRCGGGEPSTEDVFFEIGVEIVQTTTGYSEMLEVTQGCSATNHDACDGAHVQTAYPPSGYEFGDIAMTGFTLTSLVNGGTKIRRIAAAANTYHAPPDVTVYSHCWIGEVAAPYSGMSCEVSGLLFAVSPSELQAVQSFTINLGSVTPPNPTPPKRQASYYFDFPIAQNKPALCALRSFALWSLNPPFPLPPGSQPIWSMWSYVGTDCGSSPGPRYNGNVYVNLGDTHPGFPFPPTWWNTYQPYEFEIRLNGLQFK